MRSVAMNVRPRPRVHHLLDRPQFEPGNTDGDVKTGLALEAQRLKRERIVRASHQRIGTQPPPRHRRSHPVTTPEIPGADASARTPPILPPILG
jgi:hypothetical protein